MEAVAVVGGAALFTVIVVVVLAPRPQLANPDRVWGREVPWGRAWRLGAWLFAGNLLLVTTDSAVLGLIGLVLMVFAIVRLVALRRANREP